MPFTRKITLTTLPGVTMNTASVGTSATLLDLEAGDFNGDGRIDFVMTRGMGFTGITPAPATFVFGTSAGGWQDRSTTAFTGAIGQSLFAPRLLIADLNGDGASDVFLPDGGTDAWPFNGAPDRVWLSQPSTGTLAASDVAGGNSFSHGFASGDIDRDGDIDVVVTNLVNDQEHSSVSWQNPSHRILVNDGAGLLADDQARVPAELHGDVAIRPRHTYASLIDLDNDGWLDLVLGTQEFSPAGPLGYVASRVYWNDGTGSFGARGYAELPAAPVANQQVIDIDAIDLDGDGLQDMIVSVTRGNPSDGALYYSVGYLQFLVNNGDGTFRDETALRLPQAANETGWGHVFVRLVDMNADGALDIVTAANGTQGAYDRNEAGKIFLNDGSGHFSLAYVLSTDDFNPNVTTVADVNGDGRPDLVGVRWNWDSATTATASLYARINDLPVAPPVGAPPMHLAGTTGNDALAAGSGDDWLHGFAGNDTMDGGAGLDTAVFAGARADHLVASTGMGASVTGAGSGADTLQGVERLRFSDRGVALDLDGAAGEVVKLLGAIFGAPTVHDAGIVGIGLHYADTGMGYEALAQLALDYQAPGVGNGALVDLLWANVIGGATPPDQHTYFTGLLDSHAFSQVGLAMMAADTSYNADHIGLAGLAAGGVDYTPA